MADPLYHPKDDVAIAIRWSGRGGSVCPSLFDTCTPASALLQGNAL